MVYTPMEQYKDEEQLQLPKLIRITAEVHEILKKERNRLRKKDRRISMAKLMCNAVIEKYGKTD